MTEPHPDHKLMDFARRIPLDEVTSLTKGGTYFVVKDGYWLLARYGGRDHVLVCKTTSSPLWSKFRVSLERIAEKFPGLLEWELRVAKVPWVYLRAGGLLLEPYPEEESNVR